MLQPEKASAGGSSTVINKQDVQTCQLKAATSSRNYAAKKASFSATPSGIFEGDARSTLRADMKERVLLSICMKASNC